MAEVLGRADPGQPVSRLVAPVVLRFSTLLVLMTAVCVVGMIASAHAVTQLTDDLQPVASAHDALVADMADMQAAVLTEAAGGGPAQTAAFRSAAARSVLDEQALRAAVSDDADLRAAVDAELVQVDAYRDDAAPAQLQATTTAGATGISGSTGSTVTTTALFRGAAAAATAFRVASEHARVVLVQRADDARSASVLRFRLAIVTSLVLLGASWLLLGRSRTALLQQVSEPLLALERVVGRMLRNDPEGRADEDRGPKEVRSVARALNDFADAQSRARAVEGRITDELHVLDSAKEDFVSNVSHELRTPLTTISGYLEVVADEFEGRLEPRHERMLEATRRNVARLRALIDDLLALSKAETRPSEVAPADVVAMVREAVTDVRMTAARRGITVDLTTPDEPVLVVCESTMLYRAFLNVLTNAVKFSHVDGTVEVDVTRVGSRVEVAVRDRGIGIPRAELDRLGTRFFRASNAMSNEIAGTGLGLRIVQTIIDKHDGDVIIESGEGVGTTVFVRLRSHDDAVATPVGAAPGPTTAP